MQISENQIIVKRTARYFVLGTPSEKTSEIWFVLHGYGQSALHFLKKMENFETPQRVFVAPEGLSKFYWQGFGGHVGASWMTKEMREAEIEDYTQYLNQVFEEILDKNNELKNNTKNLKVNILAFSQGCATACRWLCETSFTPEKLILCSGNFPHDWDFERMKTKLHHTKISVVFGKQDELINENQFDQHLKEVHSKGFEPEIFFFEGKHELHLETIAKLI
jgi:predicted esterase